MESPSYKCYQPCLAMKVTVCALVTKCEWRFLACLKDCFHFEDVWENSGKDFVTNKHLRTKPAHCGSCSLSDFSDAKVDEARNALTKRIRESENFLHEMKERHNNVKKLIGGGIKLDASLDKKSAGGNEKNE